MTFHGCPNYPTGIFDSYFLQLLTSASGHLRCHDPGKWSKVTLGDWQFLSSGVYYAQTYQKSFSTSLVAVTFGRQLAVSRSDFDLFDQHHPLTLLYDLLLE